MRDWLEAGAMFIYVPIGDEVRYDADIRRGRTWSICAIMDLNRRLHKRRILWLGRLLRMASNAPMVIVMENVSIHIHERVTQLIESEGHVPVLPPHSLPQSCRTYGDFLELSIRESSDVVTNN
jgi:hypothetical protein